MKTYIIHFIVVCDGEDEEDAVWNARHNYLNRDDFEPDSIEEEPS